MEEAGGEQVDGLSQPGGGAHDGDCSLGTTCGVWELAFEKLKKCIREKKHEQDKKIMEILLEVLDLFAGVEPYREALNEQGMVQLMEDLMRTPALPEGKSVSKILDRILARFSGGAERGEEEGEGGGEGGGGDLGSSGTIKKEWGVEEEERARKTRDGFLAKLSGQTSGEKEEAETCDTTAVRDGERSERAGGSFI